MSLTVRFPAADRPAVIGSLSREQVLGVVGACLCGGAIIASGSLLPWGALIPVLLLWSFGRWRGVYWRESGADRIRWWVRRRRRWSAPLVGDGGSPPFMGDVAIRLVNDGPTPIGVVENGDAFTAVMLVERESMAMRSGTDRDEMMSAWGAVLDSLCVERGSDITAVRAGWLDVHSASDPRELQHYHASRGVDGPATADYEALISTYGEIASEHRVYVWATVSKATEYRLARKEFAGSRGEQMCKAAVAVGKRLASDLAGKGFAVSQLLSPAEIGRLIVDVADPFQPARDVSAAERFGLPERTAPNTVDASRRDRVAMDGALHRGFAMQLPRSEVTADWLFKPLALRGPKIVACVFEPTPPSRADHRRDGARTRVSSNNRSARSTGDGHVKAAEQQRAGYLNHAEQVVSSGRRELDAYALVVLSARDDAELAARSGELRQALRDAGRASVREMHGQHDLALAAALPLGLDARTSG